VVQRTQYPWSGDITIKVDPEGAREFELALRVPGWARNQPVPSELYRFADRSDEAVTLEVNGKPAPLNLDHGYALLRRTWSPGDEVRLMLPMPIRRVLANEAVEADRDRVAFQRGPIVFAAEQADNAGVSLRHTVVDRESPLTVRYQASLLDGVEVMTTPATASWRNDEGKLETKAVTLTAIPYYAWANRGAGAMEVWLAEQATVLNMPNPTLASRSKVSASLPTAALNALNDQDEPKKSIDHAVSNFHWAKKGTKEWVQYSFPQQTQVAKIRVYWWDEAPWGEGRVPSSARLLAHAKDGSWQEVSSPTPLGLAKDCYNELAFAPLTTDALRLEVQVKPKNLAGILEWQVE
jgi:hypothetical protein